MTDCVCGHCGERFDDMTDLREHAVDCDDHKCQVCGAEFDDLRESLDHSPCPEAEPVPDPEGEFRAERRRREQLQKEERRIRHSRRKGR